MADASARKKSSGTSNLFDWLGSLRQEVTRVAGRVRDSLPPVMIEHRLEVLERHVDSRLGGMEAKLDEILGRLEQRRRLAGAKGERPAKTVLRASAK